ncbi:3-oxoacyl-[acyl-carrier protein] reductase [Labilithrix luteola]|uniref:3-oxoacyl-[acyl-carrier protein] reductase n=1 Tax=Labilithrix luteola TaxID=1391654 RepID=A0A0K1PY17_9BACT|nr:SDR family NAD(P)-dependent oxidoreductase [Labilithrix luteola]AKU98261.1 3-oxoacyl-[acyl-carrier protein] reductase [Labilithrix luteola]
MSQSLQGKVALVTGSSRGIGRSIALALGAAGVRVAVNHRADRTDADAVVDAISALGSDAIAVRGDVAVPDDVSEMVATVRRQLGPIDILVSNAGIARPLPLESVHLATWDATFAVNLRGPFIVTSAVLPDMRARQWGRLLYISSTAARVGGVVGPHYAASKAGLEGLVHSYASILAKEGITANAIAPALIETEMLAGNMAIRADRIPVGRLGTPDEVASMVIAVASNPYVTGQTIQVNGGIYMT